VATSCAAGLADFVITAPTAGTAVNLGVGLIPAGAYISPDPCNGGTVFLGSSTVTKDTGQIVYGRVPLANSLLLRGTELELSRDKIFIVGTEDGDKVRISYTKR